VVYFQIIVCSSAALICSCVCTDVCLYDLCGLLVVNYLDLLSSGEEHVVFCKELPPVQIVSFFKLYCSCVILGMLAVDVCMSVIVVCLFA